MTVTFTIEGRTHVGRLSRTFVGHLIRLEQYTNGQNFWHRTLKIATQSSAVVLIKKKIKECYKYCIIK